MKNLYLSAVLLLSAGAYGQSNCNEVIKENTTLKNKVSFLEEKVKFSNAFNNDSVTTIKSFNSDFEFKLVNCSGSTSNQSVKVEVLVTLKSTNQKLLAKGYGAKAIDNLGKEYVSAKTRIGSGYSANELFTGIPVLIIMEFPSIMPQTEKFELVSINLANRRPNEMESKFTFTELRNIPITWD